jgi:hypothetical protein
VLPDGIFWDQKSQFVYILEGLKYVEDGVFYGLFVYFETKWYILWSCVVFFPVLVCCTQGDQIGRILVQLLIVYSGQIFWKLLKSPPFWAIFPHLRLSINFDKKGLGYFLCDFLTNPSGHPGCTEKNLATQFRVRFQSSSPRSTKIWRCLLFGTTQQLAPSFSSGPLPKELVHTQKNSADAIHPT